MSITARERAELAGGRLAPQSTFLAVGDLLVLLVFISKLCYICHAPGAIEHLLAANNYSH